MGVWLRGGGAEGEGSERKGAKGEKRKIWAVSTGKRMEGACVCVCGQAWKEKEGRERKWRIDREDRVNGRE